MRSGMCKCRVLLVLTDSKKRAPKIWVPAWQEQPHRLTATILTDKYFSSV